MRTPHFINDTSPGVTISAGVAAALTKVVAYQVQPGSDVLLSASSVVMLKDRGATETADKSKVEIRVVKANQKGMAVLAQSVYLMLKRNQDTRIQFHPIQGTAVYRLRPFDYLEVHVNSDQTLAAASLDFALQAEEEARA